MSAFHYLGFPWKPRKIKTVDLDGKQNGYILEVGRNNNGSEVKAYISVIEPRSFKGYHQHTKITQTFHVLSQGKLLFILWQKGYPQPEYHLVGCGMMLTVPVGIVIGIKNYSEKQMKILCLPDPAYNIIDTKEQIKIPKEELEDFMKNQPNEWAEYERRMEHGE